MPCRCECDCYHLWDAYHIWTVRSTSLKIATVSLLAAFLLNVIAIMSNHWLDGPEGGTGLFDYEIKGGTGTSHTIPMVCPTLAVMSAVVLFCDNILNLLFVTRRFHLAMPAVIVFAFVGALMLMTVIVTWSVPQATSGGQHLSWSFILATISVVVDMAGCGMCVMEFLSVHERPRVPSLSLPSYDDVSISHGSDVNDSDSPDSDDEESERNRTQSARYQTRTGNVELQNNSRILI